MWLDLISGDSFIMANKKIALVYNLNVAVYTAEVLNILKTAIRKNKLSEDGFVTLDRKYLTNQTTLSIDDQYECDRLLAKTEVIKIAEENKDQIYFDVKKFVAILSSNDSDELERLAKEVKKGTRKANTEAKRQSVIENIKRGIIETDIELLTGYRDWIDSVYASGKFLTKKSVEIFQDTINKYTNDREVKKQLLSIGVTTGYTEAAWVINRYESNLKTSINSKPIVSKPSDGVSDQTF